MIRLWPRAVQVEMAGQTDRGLVRRTNEDHVLTVSSNGSPDWILALAGVFDGVAGLPAGEQASAAAARYVVDTLQVAERPQDEDGLCAAVRSSMLAAHKHLLNDGMTSTEMRGMATTATVALIARSPKERLVVGHVGDGAAFLIRGQSIERLTPMDTYSSGPVEGEVAASRFGTSIEGRLTQALGYRSIVPHMYTNHVKRGDWIVLSTDGLVSNVGKDIIMQATVCVDPNAACQFLVDAAKEAGGDDNIGVVVIRIR